MLCRFAALVFWVPVLSAQGVIQTIVGTDWLFPDDGKPALGSALGAPSGLAFDSEGNLYIADSGNSMVFRVGRDGVIRVIAGNGIRGYSGDGGPATSASLNLSGSIAGDTQGNVYLTESAGQAEGRIRRISPGGIIHRFAGGGVGPRNADGIPALNVSLPNIGGMAADARGNLYFIHGGVLRKVDVQGIITTVATVPGIDGLPAGLAVGPDGSVYIAATFNNQIRRVAPDGTISTFAGNGQEGPLTGIGGPATEATISAVWDVVADLAGNVYFISARGGDGALLQVDTQGILRVVLGPRSFLAGPGPGLARSDTGELFFSDRTARRVRRVRPDGAVGTIAGEGNYRSSPPGVPPTETVLSDPQGVFSDFSGNLLIADSGANRVLRLAPNGVVTTVASGVCATDITADSAGNIYAACESVVRIDPSGVVTPFAGFGEDAGDGVPAVQARFGFLTSVAADAAGNVYIADATANRVRRVGLDGIITTIAGTGEESSTGDGGPAINATLTRPQGIATDDAGNIFVAEFGWRIRRISPGGIISTVAVFQVPGRFVDVAVDRTTRNLYVATDADNRVLAFSPAGVLLGQIGTGQQGFRGDGGPAPNALLNSPKNVAVDAAGRVLVSDTGNHRVRAVDRATRPNLQLSATSLTFRVLSNGLNPPPQGFDVRSFVIELPFTVAAATTAGGTWLSATPGSGGAPARVSASVDGRGLAPGTYQGSILVTAPDADPPTQRVEVQLIVAPPGSPVPSAQPASLIFEYFQGAQPRSQQLLVSNLGGGSFAFFVAPLTDSHGDWLRVSPLTGTARTNDPVILTVSAIPGELAPGTYGGSIVVVPSGADAINVRVTMTITAVPQRILLSQADSVFTTVVGGGGPPPRHLFILNQGSGVLNWTASASTLSGGQGWLRISRTSGASNALEVPDAVEVRIDPTGLAPGEYYGRVEVRAAAVNSPQSLPVVLNVLPAGTALSPVVEPAGLLFTGVAGAGSPGSQTLRISNSAGGPVSFQSSQQTARGGNWVTRVPSNGTVQPGEPLRVIVQPETAGLAAGVYSGTLTLGFSDGSLRTVAVLLVLAPGETPADSLRSAAGCAPSRLLPVFTSIGQDFEVAAAWPVPIVTRVVDDCGAAMTRGSVIVSFNNGDPPLSLAAVGDGSWSATWASRGGRTGDISITVNAETPEPGLRGSTVITGGLRANPNPPRIAPGGVLSAASFERQAPLAPGSFISIYGSRLSDVTSLADRFPFEVRRAGTEVVLAGRSLPLHYTSDGQVNALIPYGLEVNTTHQLLVIRGNTLSLPEPVTIAAARPAVFAVNSAGAGQGHIYRAPANTLADAAAPVRAGDVVVIYCTGLGPVDPPVEAGQAAPAEPLSQTVHPVSLTIGGRAAMVLFAGLTPGFSGLYQVNAVIPEGIAPGDAVPVVLSVAGQSSPAVTMAAR
jgi:uncharacterized protein (TIGR03437 family)